MFEISEKLKQSVTENMPEGYTNLEKALYIYQELCQRLEYSLEYLIDKKNVVEYFKDPANLKLIDGEKNKDVICYTIEAICLQILIEEGICDDYFFSIYGKKLK